MSNMRQKTKEELTRLAEILISKYQIEKIKGTSEFLECALVEARRGDIALDNQSVKKYEQWLESKCIALQDHVDYMASQSKSLPENNRTEVEKYDDNFYDCYGFVIEDMTIVRRAVDVMSKLVKENTPNQEFFDDLFDDGFTETIVHKPVYTIFNDVDGKITIARGSYSKDEYANKSPKEIDEIRGWSCMPGWANDMLKKNTELGENRPGALTDDDKIVLGKIMRNQL